MVVLGSDPGQRNLCSKWWCEVKDPDQRNLCSKWWCEVKDPDQRNLCSKWWCEVKDEASNKPFPQHKQLLLTRYEEVAFYNNNLSCVHMQGNHSVMLVDELVKLGYKAKKSGR